MSFNPHSPPRISEQKESMKNEPLTQDQFNKQFPNAIGKCVCAVLNKDWNTSGVAVVYPNGYVCQTWKEPAEADRFVHHSAITFDISY